MRIVQIIDSLEAGGAERMAVNYANALSSTISFSALVSSRKEGSLKQFINQNVHYLFLNKKRTIDFGAVLRLRRFCITNNINFVHAHSSSYFLAMLVKLSYPKLQIIWHDHNGMSEFLSSRESVILRFSSYFFKGIIVVNHQLKNWAAAELHCKKIIYLPNFTKKEENQISITALHGTPGKRILCLANLRVQKNHFMLIDIADRVRVSHPEWTFHLVGKEFEDEYHAAVIKDIEDRNLQQHVFIYGSKSDTAAILTQSDIAILSSSSEGLPVALLEYGLYEKPVVVTAVGEIPQIIVNGENGLMVEPTDNEAFYAALVTLIEDPEKRQKFATALYKTIMQNNSGITVISQYINWLKNL